MSFTDQRRVLRRFASSLRNALSSWSEPLADGMVAKVFGLVSRDLCDLIYLRL
jgi:hypothetical protein